MVSIKPLYNYKMLNALIPIVMIHFELNSKPQKQRITKYTYTYIYQTLHVSLHESYYEWVPILS